MKETRTAPHKLLFRRTFLTISALSAVPLLLVLLVLFFFVYRSSETETIVQGRSQLQEYIRQIDAQILSARMESLKLASNADTVSFITNPTFDLIDRNSGIMKQLNALAASHEDVESAYVYSHHSRLVLTSEMRGYRQLQFEDGPALSLYSEHYANEPFEIREDLRSGREGEYLVSIYQNVPVSSADILGCVIINLPAESLFASVPRPFSFDLSIYTDGGTHLYSWNKDISYQLSSNFQEKLASNEDSFIYQDGDQRLMIMDAQSALTGMRFVAAQPLSAFYGRINRALYFTVFISAAAILISLFLSYIFSRRLTAPVGKMIEEMQPVLKRDLFKRLLLGNTAANHPVARDLSLIEEGFGPENYAAVIFMVPDRETYLKENDDETRAQHEAMLRSLIDEAVNGQYPYAVNKMHRCFWVLSLNIKNEAALARLRTVFASAVPELPFPLVFECGSVCKEPSDLRISYKEAVEKLEEAAAAMQDKEAAAPSAEAQPEPKEIPLQVPKLSAEESAAGGGSIEKMIAYINAHLSEDISLQDLADMCGISPSYVSRLFRDRLGIGFVEYLNTLRVRRAQKLLEETGQSVEKIGMAVGFNNNRSFIRTFKQYCGLTPSQYRTRQTKE